MSEKVIVSWSGGKDSALALFEIKRDKRYELAGLLTTVTRDYDRISIHGVRRALLEEQASALAAPLRPVYIPKDCTDLEYAKTMEGEMARCKEEGISKVVFADIFLEDIRRYREHNLAKLGMEAIFPLWKADTALLARRFIDMGFRAVITALDSRVLDKEFAGRLFDHDHLSQLPPHVDPCGENGEFHSFVFDGPIFSRPVAFEKGEVVLREGRFYFCDLVPGAE